MGSVSSLSRAERRRRERERRKGGEKSPDVIDAAMQGAAKRQNNGTITLQNPVQKQFESFIVGNWLRMMAGELPPEIAADPLRYFEAIQGIAEQQGDWYRCDAVVEENEAEGQHVLICGAGPSLKEHIDERRPDADQVWGCNSAAIWLHEHGHEPTHGFTVDQTPAMLNEWESAPDLRYLCATTIHPHLLEHLLDRGREVRFFNNYVGLQKNPVAWEDEDGEVQSMPFEDWLYSITFMPTVRAGAGLNSVTRAIDVANFMGFEKITVLGADCALSYKRRLPAGVKHGTREHKRWLEEDVTMHVDGGNALASGATGVTLGGEIDGRWWESKPDLLVSAVYLTKMKQYYGERLELVGDTLPNALEGKPDEFLRRLPNLQDQHGNVVLP